MAELTGREVNFVAMTAHGAGDRQDPPAEQPGAAAAGHDFNPLQRLIRQRLREQGWSYGDVARRSGLARSTVSTLAITRNLTRPPRLATINALAEGLGLPVSAVRAAAAESVGLHYYDQAPARREGPGDPERELLIASIDELTPEDRGPEAGPTAAPADLSMPPGTPGHAKPRPEIRGLAGRVDQQVADGDGDGGGGRRMLPGLVNACRGRKRG